MYYVIQNESGFYSVTQESDILQLTVCCQCRFEDDAIEIATALNLLANDNLRQRNVMFYIKFTTSLMDDKKWSIVELPNVISRETWAKDMAQKWTKEFNTPVSVAVVSSWEE